MSRYEVIDDALIAATPAQVLAAINDEGAGRSCWWAPYLRLRSFGEGPATTAGVHWEMAWHADAPSGGGPRRLWARAVVVRSDRSGLSLRYLSGDLAGTLDLAITPAFAGHSLVRSRLAAEPRGWLRLTGYVRDVPAHQHRIMQHAFLGIEEHATLHRIPLPA